MQCIAETAECDDVRCEFRIEVRWCFLAMYQQHLRPGQEVAGERAEFHAPALIVWMWVDCLVRSTVPEI